jgi:hypothetical protein
MRRYQPSSIRSLNHKGIKSTKRIMANRKILRILLLEGKGASCCQGLRGLGDFVVKIAFVSRARYDDQGKSSILLPVYD